MVIEVLIMKSLILFSALFAISVAASAADVTKSFVISDAVVPEMIDVFGEGYQTTIQDENGDPIANPQSKAAFASEQFDNYVVAAVLKKVFRYRRAHLPEDEFLISPQ